MKILKRMGASAVVACALCATIGVPQAFAAAVTQVGGDGAEWTVPTAAMTNTVWKDASGNLVPEGTEGATQYKVLTTWAEAWSTSGPDYLGVSNSAYFGNGGNGNAKVETYEAAAKQTTVGVWATAANESPNAYNWNMFYNLYADTSAGVAAGAVKSDWASASTTTNGGADWSSEAGVWCGFKYRPEVVWTNNNLSADAARTYISQIKEGKYSATATKGAERNATYEPDGEDKSFYITGDENYDPQIISPNNNSPYSFVATGFELAEAVNDVITKTASNSGLAAGQALDWRTVNSLPRTNRYSQTPIECALNIEKLAKGSVYYTLAKIADGTVPKKKVAYITYPWAYSTTGRDGVTTNYTTDTQVVVAVYDYTENIGSGPMDGRVSWTSLAVDQLATNSPYGDKAFGGAVGTEDTTSSTTTYQLYQASADDLASCDVIYCSPNVAKSATEIQEWIEKNASSASNAEKAKNISYLVTWPCITNGSNFTMEKLIYGAYGMDFLYPELFPSMQLSSFWCNQIYHLNDANLASAMSWIYASASLPAGTTLSNIPAQYDRDSVIAKFEEGRDYYEANKGSDATLARVLSNTALDGTTTYGSNSYAFNAFEPSQYWTRDSADWVRLWGSSRYDTMASISNACFAQSEIAVVASGAKFPDALSASALAGVCNSPVILTKAGELSPQAKDELERLGAKRVFLMGGTAAIEQSVEDSIKALNGGIEVTRIAGADRRATSVQVLNTVKSIKGTIDTVVVATGKNFPDSLSISPYSYAFGNPIVLTRNDGTLTDDEVSAIKASGATKIVVVGGSSVVNAASVEAATGINPVVLAGDNRYLTSAAITAFELEQGMTTNTVAVATGQKAPDALAGSALCGSQNGVLLLARDNTYAPAIDVITANKYRIDQGYVLGGEAAVSAALMSLCEGATAR